MSTEKSPKNTEKYYCDKCNYGSNKLSEYKRHINTKKHKTHESQQNQQEKRQKTPTIHICECGKIYKERTGLWKHKNKCDYKPDVEDTMEEIVKEDIKEDIDYKDVILTLVKQNNELQNTIKEMIPRIGNNNTITTTNNNNQFNLQMFLNEDCKNALNIKDFVNSLQLSIKDLTDTGKLGYVDGISRIFVNALNDMDITERPIHCTDLKRETVYIKDADKWEKEGSENSKLKKTIRDIEKQKILG